MSQAPSQQHNSSRRAHNKVVGAATPRIDLSTTEENGTWLPERRPCKPTHRRPLGRLRGNPRANSPSVQAFVCCIVCALQAVELGFGFRADCMAAGGHRSRRASGVDAPGPQKPPLAPRSVLRSCGGAKPLARGRLRGGAAREGAALGTREPRLEGLSAAVAQGQRPCNSPRDLGVVPFALLARVVDEGAGAPFARIRRQPSSAQ